LPQQSLPFFSPLASWRADSCCDILFLGVGFNTGFQEKAGGIAEFVESIRVQWRVRRRREKIRKTFAFGEESKLNSN